MGKLPSIEEIKANGREYYVDQFYEHLETLSNKDKEFRNDVIRVIKEWTERFASATDLYSTLMLFAILDSFVYMAEELDIYDKPSFDVLMADIVCIHETLLAKDS